MTFHTFLGLIQNGGDSRLGSGKGPNPTESGSATFPTSTTQIFSQSRTECATGLENLHSCFEL
jgi:hypothetical protein